MASNGDFDLIQVNKNQEDFTYIHLWTRTDSFPRLALALMKDGLDIPAPCEHRIGQGVLMGGNFENLFPGPKGYWDMNRNLTMSLCPFPKVISYFNRHFRQC